MIYVLITVYNDAFAHVHARRAALTLHNGFAAECNMQKRRSGWAPALPPRYWRRPEAFLFRNLRAVRDAAAVPLRFLRPRFFGPGSSFSSGWSPVI